MHRIDSQGTVNGLPAPEAVGDTVGYFSKGNPGLGQKATVVSADWANAVQEEIVNVILGAGLSLDKTAQNQLYLGVLALIGSVAPAAHTHSAGQITSGTLADARIAQSNVTQHQAALSLNASQLTAGTLTDSRIAQSNVTQHQAALSIAETQIPDGALLARVAGNETITGSWTFPNTNPPAPNQVTSRSILKGWANQDQTGAITKSYNVSSASKSSTGIYSVNWDTDFTATNDHCGTASANAVNVGATTHSNNAGSTQVDTFNVTTGSLTDDVHYVIAVGDQ